MMSSDTIHTIRIGKLTVSGLPDEPIERELRSRLQHAETNRAAAADLCKTLMTGRDLHSNTRRYWQLERAIAQLVRANMDIARALAELGDYLVDGTLHERRPG
jgi:outer membrane PBP1 activator LpoA protein